MRQVQQLAAALARILGLRQAGLLDQAAQELDRALLDLVGLDPGLARDGDPSLLLSLVLDPQRREALKRLLAERDAIRLANRPGT